MSGIARKGDTDNFGHSISGGCDAGVTIDGAPVAVKGSTMDDGVSITSGTIPTVRFNGQPAAVVGSTTEKHTRDPGSKQQGTINSGASAVNISG